MNSPLTTHPQQSKVAIENLVGGIPTPLKNDGVRQLGSLFPTYEKKTKIQTTNQILWFSYGFPMVFLWFSYGFPMVFHALMGK